MGVGEGTGGSDGRIGVEGVVGVALLLGCVDDGGVASWGSVNRNSLVAEYLWQKAATLRQFKVSVVNGLGAKGYVRVSGVHPRRGSRAENT